MTPRRNTNKGKGTVNIMKMKRNKKRQQNHMSDKELVSIIHKKL